MGQYIPKEKTPVKAETREDDGWIVKGWLNSTKKAGTFTVKDAENNLLGFVTKLGLEKLLAGAKGVPIKMHKDFKAE